MSKGRKGDGRINREARQHVRCLNPRRARCSSSPSPPPPVFYSHCQLISPSWSRLITGRGRSPMFVLHETPSKRPWPHPPTQRRRCPLGNTPVTVVLSAALLLFYDNQSS